MAPLVAYRFPPTEGATLIDVPEGQINLGIGAPDDTLLQRACAALAVGTATALARPLSHRLLQYGPVQGDGGFLAALAAFLDRQYADAAHPVAK